MRLFPISYLIENYSVSDKHIIEDRFSKYPKTNYFSVDFTCIFLFHLEFEAILSQNSGNFGSSELG